MAEQILNVLCKRLWGMNSDQRFSTIEVFALFQFGINLSESSLDSEHFRYSLPLLIATHPLCVEVKFEVT